MQDDEATGLHAGPTRVPACDDAVLRHGAATLARRITAGELSAREVAGAYLRRIEVLEPLIHAFADFDPDLVLAQALDADERQAAGETLGALHGVPVTIKDWIEVEGWTCAAGYEERLGVRPRQDATAAARLRAAGAVILGKTVTNDGGTLYPRPCNPHGLGHSPGGSSGAEAATVAAFASPLGLGSDSGGSIRLPAAWCGVMGLKPTIGRVPLTGHFPRLGNISDPRTVIGPLARHVEDLALSLRLTSGLDDYDPAVVPMPLGAWEAVELKGLRVGLTDFGGETLTADAWAALQGAGRRLEGLGAMVEPAELPILEESLAITQAYWARPESMSHREWKPYGSSTLSADAVEESLFRWERLQRRMETFMADWDVLICPVTEGAAPEHRRMEANDYLYTLPFSLTGQPALSVPAGWSDGLPLGAQIVARRWRDDVALAVAKGLEPG
ncbi:MAG TPA: amidase [Caulobacteraceae bacterium]